MNACVLVKAGFGTLGSDNCSDDTVIQLGRGGEGDTWITVTVAFDPTGCAFLVRQTHLLRCERPVYSCRFVSTCPYR